MKAVELLTGLAFPRVESKATACDATAKNTKVTAPTTSWSGIEGREPHGSTAKNAAAAPMTHQTYAWSALFM